MLTLREVSERLGCSLANIYALKDQGVLPVVAVGAGGKGFRVREDDLASFIEGRKKGRGPELSNQRSSPRPHSFKHLDQNRLLASWRRQGISAGQQDADSAPSSRSFHGPSKSQES